MKRDHIALEGCDTGDAAGWGAGMELEEIRDRIESLHKRRLGEGLSDDETAELKALYQQEQEAQQARKSGADG